MSICTAKPHQKHKSSRDNGKAGLTKQSPLSSFTAIVISPLPTRRLGIRCNAQGISAICFLPATTALQDLAPEHPQAKLARRLITALQAYFDHPEQGFSLPLAATGSPFQQRVWQAISAIPSGKTRSYGQLANDIGSAPRAIGGACRANPLPLLVPCHRVIAADGGNGGFLGQAATQGMAAETKTWLLQHEQS